jgi:beta-lactam-binding protein with PASTA domain
MSQAGILPSLTWVPGSDELGTVVAQAKPSGTIVPYHSHVQINLSSGPGTKTAEQVPNVVGKSLKDALATINGAHLRMIYVKLSVSDRSQAGKVVQQSPLGGTAPENAQIVVWLGAYGS